MNTRVKILVSSVMASVGLSAGVALAAPSSITNAHVVSVRADPFNGQGVITLDTADPNRPSCSTFNAGKSFTVSFSSAAGREAFHLALSAFLANKTVDVTGTGACTEQTNKEAIDVLVAH
jgi:hypothetical protein